MAARVLIVEDDDILRDIYSVKFEIEGFIVRTAPDGQSGLEMVVLHEPDLIILDMLMPKLGGMEFLRQFQEKYSASPIIILVASNKSDREMIEQAKALGARDYLIKSQLTPDDIVVHARKHLDGIISQ